MNHIAELTTEMTNLDLQDVVRSYSELLLDPANADVTFEFPTSLKYTGEVKTAVANLQETASACKPGVRQQFIAYSADRAVGMSVVRLADDVPEAIDPAWPNVSLFVCNPYRAQGLGRLLLMAPMHMVNRNFGGSAWTSVRRSNEPSHRLVTRAGFRPVSEAGDSIIYTYGVKNIG